MIINRLDNLVLWISIDTGCSKYEISAWNLNKMVAFSTAGPIKAEFKKLWKKWDFFKVQHKITNFEDQNIT